MSKPNLADVVAALEAIAPLGLAADWDNVGLLISPSRPRAVGRILLTIDLTSAVLNEAISSRADLVVAYHPAIFTPLARIGERGAVERVVLRAIEARLPIYSPHTAIDAAPGGVNDWLADGLGPSRRRAIERPSMNVDFAMGQDDDGAPPIAGQGRLVDLDRARDVSALVRRVKKWTGLQRVRVATAERHAGGEPVRRVALCAGAGGSVLSDVDADLLWTGEMRHHDVLAAVEAGRSVLLCDHTNTERGFLPVLKRRLEEALGSAVRVDASRRDRDPLVVV